MPRKKKLDAPAGLPAVLETLKEANPTLKTAVELSPPEREVIEPTQEPRPRPSPHKNGEERSFMAKVRPTGPRRRDPNDPANILASADARIDKDGAVYEVTLSDKPDAARYAQLQKWGFDDATEHNTGEQWLGFRKDLIKQNTDINYVAMVLRDVNKDRTR